MFSFFIQWQQSGILHRLKQLKVVDDNASSNHNIEQVIPSLDFEKIIFNVERSVPPTKSHSNYQATFQMHQYSKILLNCPLKRYHLSYKDTFFLQTFCSCRRGDLMRTNLFLFYLGDFCFPLFSFAFS